nr:hypothetical protein [Candidatus Baldrarchaeota archaeon]
MTMQALSPNANQRQLILILIFILAFSAVFLVYATVTGMFEVTNTGYVKAIGVEVYFDEGCTSEASSIDWGYLSPGERKTIIVYVRNNGTVPMTLSHTVQNWNPADAQNYITFSWDGEGKTVDAGEVIAVNLSLNVAENITGIESFSFELIIIGTES